MLVGIIFFLWPLSFYMYIPRWDNVDGFLPYRYFISDYVWNGHFPYWNGFQFLGYPAYADPQSGMWNPITWILMLFGKYTMGSLITELLIYYILSGLGMYWLIQSIYKNAQLSAIMGLSYALSGLMVGTAQLMVFIAGTAWLPWCMAAIYNFSRSFQWKYAILSGLFIALNTVVASPAYTIVLIYIYLFAFLYFLWENRKSIENIIQLLKGAGLMLLVAAVLLMPYIVSFLDVYPYFDRTGKVDFEEYALRNSYMPLNLISFIFPYAIVSDLELLKTTDISTRNVYFGIIPFVFFLYSLIKYWKVKKLRVLFFISLFFILLSFGKFFPLLYKIIYELPGFGLFAHPSFLRTYAVFLMMIIAAYGLNEYLKKQTNIAEKVNFNKKKLLLGLFLALFVAGALFLLKPYIFQVFRSFQDYVKSLGTVGVSFSIYLWVNIIILLLLALLMYVLKKTLKWSNVSLLMLFIFLDLGIQTSVSAFYTMVFNLPFQNYKTYFKDLPNEISQENLDQAMVYFDEERKELKREILIWASVAGYNKTLSYEGYNPFKINKFKEAFVNGHLDYNLSNPLFFFADREKTSEDEIGKGLVWGNRKFEYLDSDKTLIDYPIVDYNRFATKVKNDSDYPQLLLLNQNYYHHWQAYVNQEKTEILLLNDHIMGIFIPPHTSADVEFKFEYKGIFYAIGIAILGYLSLLLYFILLKFRTPLTCIIHHILC